jgi:hypothetical protein
MMTRMGLESTGPPAVKRSRGQLDYIYECWQFLRQGKYGVLHSNDKKRNFFKSWFGVMSPKKG